MKLELLTNVTVVDDAIRFVLFRNVDIEAKEWISTRKPITRKGYRQVYV